MTDFIIGLVIFYMLMNIAATYVLVIGCFANLEYDGNNILIFPLIVEKLRERLNIAGTVIITSLFTIIFLPAIIIYFVVFGILVLSLVVGKLFLQVFERRD
jgi:hypothetical protein